MLSEGSPAMMTVVVESSVTKQHGKVARVSTPRLAAGIARSAAQLTVKEDGLLLALDPNVHRHGRFTAAL